MQKNIIINVVTAVICWSGLHAAVAVDIAVRRSDGATYRGEFTKMGRESVIVKRTNGEEVEISVADLKSVQFDGEPPTLNQARSNERSGALDTALQKLTEIQKSYSGSDARLKKEIQFLIARVKAKQALLNPDLLDEAIGALEEFRTADKNNFRYYEATLLQGRLYGAKGDTDKARALLAEVQQCPVVPYQLLAGVELGRLLLSAGKAAEALTAFDQVISQSKGKPEAAAAYYDSMLGKALCLKEQNQLDEAIRTLDDVIENAPPEETRTLAEAWLRKGDCLLQKNQTKPALMAYLHVDVLYSGEAAQHAEALYRLAQLWGPAGYQNRSVEASARLTEKYGSSQWAQKLSAGG